MFILQDGERIHKQATHDTAAEIATRAVEHMDILDETERAIATEAAFIAAEIALELRDSVAPIQLTTRTEQPTIFEGVIQ